MLRVGLRVVLGLLLAVTLFAVQSPSGFATQGFPINPKDTFDLTPILRAQGYNIPNVFNSHTPPAIAMASSPDGSRIALKVLHALDPASTSIMIIDLKQDGHARLIRTIRLAEPEGAPLSDFRFISRRWIRWTFGFSGHYMFTDLHEERHRSFEIDQLEPSTVLALSDTLYAVRQVDLRTHKPICKLARFHPEKHSSATLLPTNVPRHDRLFAHTWRSGINQFEEYLTGAEQARLCVREIAPNTPAWNRPLFDFLLTTTPSGEPFMDLRAGATQGHAIQGEVHRIALRPSIRPKDLTIQSRSDGTSQVWPNVPDHLVRRLAVATERGYVVPQITPDRRRFRLYLFDRNAPRFAQIIPDNPWTLTIHRNHLMMILPKRNSQGDSTLVLQRHGLQGPQFGRPSAPCSEAF